MTYTLNEARMYADISDGIAVIIDSETGIYFGMNGFGTHIYENIVDGVPVEEIAAAGAREGFPEEFSENLKQFVATLLEKEILIASSALPKEPHLDKALAEADAHVPELQEFSDAQELLLADPIHNVKEEEGWSPEKTSLNEDDEDVARREAKMGS